jgi:flagellar protein FliS
MMPAMKRQHEYITQRVQSASPIELIRILYEAALQAVDEALRALRSGDISSRGRAVNKTIEILGELQSSLRHDVNQEYSTTLAGLYSYMQGQLIRAHSEQSEDLFQEAARLLQTLLEGWTGAQEKLASGQEQPAQRLEREPQASTEKNPYSGESVGSGRSWQV